MTEETATHAWDNGIWSIKDLIHECKSANDQLNAALLYASNLERSALNLIQTLGPVLLSEDSWLDAENVVDGRCWVETDFGIPEFSFVGMSFEKYNKKGDGFQDWLFILVQRVHKLPNDWAPRDRGYAYLIAVINGWKCFDEKEGGPANFVRATYATLDEKTQQLSLCRYKRTKSVQLPSGHSYARTQWEVDPYFAKRIDEKTPRLSLAGMALAAAATADSQWRFTAVFPSEARKRYAPRITACINPTLVKRLFKDRQKLEYAVTRSGKRRPILHFASAHIRKIKAKPKNRWQFWLWRLLPFTAPEPKQIPVKPHLRGMTHFHIKDIECWIKVPGKDSPLRGDSGLTLYSSDNAPIYEYDSDQSFDESFEMVCSPRPRYYNLIPTWRREAA